MFTPEDQQRIEQVFKEFQESNLPTFLAFDSLISGNVRFLEEACIADDGNIDDNERELLNWFWDHLCKMRNLDYASEVFATLASYAGEGNIIPNELDIAKVTQVFKEFKEADMPTYLGFDCLIHGDLRALREACIADDGNIDDSERELLYWYQEHLHKMKDPRYADEVFQMLIDNCR